MKKWLGYLLFLLVLLSMTVEARHSTQWRYKYYKSYNPVLVKYHYGGKHGTWLVGSCKVRIQKTGLLTSYSTLGTNCEDNLDPELFVINNLVGASKTSLVAFETSKQIIKKAGLSNKVYGVEYIVNKASNTVFILVIGEDYTLMIWNKRFPSAGATITSARQLFK
jgi:hypothetical protein